MTGRMLGRALAWVPRAQRSTKAVRLAEKRETERMVLEETVPEMLARVGDEAYEHRNDPVPDGAKVTRGHGRTRTLQVRLNDVELSELNLMAEAAEVPVSTLVRGMLLRQMRSDDSPAAVLDKVMSELEVLRRKVAS